MYLSVCMLFCISDVEQNPGENYNRLHIASKKVDQMLMTTDGVGSSNLPSVFKNSFNVLPLDIQLNNNYISHNANYIKENTPTKTKPKYAAVESDSSATFEMASGLKNYATVNTADPIPTQLSYNIGTENIENGKDGETLNDTQMELEENSIITEIENAAIDLLDIERNSLPEPSGNSFDVEMFGNEQAELITNTYQNKGNKSPNVKIISVQDIVPSENQDILDKQIYMPEALQMSLACEEETPSSWIDVMNLMNMSPVYEQLPMVENPANALPTTIQSYIDLTTPQTNLAETQLEPNYYLEDGSDYLQDKGSSMNNVLKDLTADADICKCVDCKCDSYNSCHGCNQTSEPEQKSVKNQGIVSKESINPSTTQKENISSCCSSKSCNCCIKASCCSDKVEKPVAQHNNNNNTKRQEDCCVVVCLKSLDHLREMLAIANGCYNFQNLNIGCVKSDVCSIKK